MTPISWAASAVAYVPRKRKMCEETSHELLSSFGSWEGNVAQVPEQVDEPRRLTANASKYCEIGFNTGNSAFEVLRSNETAKIHTFDLGGKNSVRAYEHLKRCYGDRLHMTWGDSTVTVPRTAALGCDVFFVDGGHDYEIAKADLFNVLDRHADKNAVVIMDDVCTNADYCAGPNRAWNEAVSEGLCREMHRWEDSEGPRSWAVGHCYSASK